MNLDPSARRTAFDAFQSGNCNWCGRDGRTMPVRSGGKLTGERICSDCRARHASLGPATHPAVT